MSDIDPAATLASLRLMLERFRDAERGGSVVALVATGDYWKDRESMAERPPSWRDRGECDFEGSYHGATFHRVYLAGARPAVKRYEALAAQIMAALDRVPKAKRRGFGPVAEWGAGKGSRNATTGWSITIAEAAADGAAPTARARRLIWTGDPTDDRYDLELLADPRRRSAEVSQYRRLEPRRGPTMEHADNGRSYFISPVDVFAASADALAVIVERLGTAGGKAPPLPKTRRGLQKLAETTTKDQRIIAAVEGGDSYSQAAKRCGVSKSTVGRVAEAYGLTGHSPDAVPFGGTISEKLTIRGKPGKHGENRG